jgi:hypothetical protein
MTFDNGLCWRWPSSDLLRRRSIVGSITFFGSHVMRATNTKNQWIGVRNNLKHPMWSIFHGKIHGFQFWFSLPIDWSDSRSDHWMRNVDLAESNLSLGWCWIWTRSSSFPLRNRALFWLRPNWLKRLKTSKKHEFPCRRLPRWIRKYLFSSALESAWNVHGLA